MAKTVQLASGKKADVGSTKRIGKFSYTVQSDGSVKRSDGKVTAAATGTAMPAKAPKAAPTVSTARQPAAPVPLPRTARPSAPKPAASKTPVSGLRLPTAPLSKPFTKGGNAGAKAAKPVQDKVLGMNTGIWRKPEAKITVQVAAKPKVDVAKQYGSNSTKKVDVAKMYGSRPSMKK